MKTLPADLEALMPKPFGYVPFPGEFYPPDELDAEVKNDPAVPSVFTADQVREAMQAATERAAKLAATLAYDAAIKYADGYVVDFEDIGDAIRAATMHEGGGKTT